MVKQIMIEGRMEMIACVVDPFSQRAHGILQQAGDIIAVDATSSLDLQDTKLVRFVTCSPAGGIELGYMLVSHENEETLAVAFDLFKTPSSYPRIQEQGSRQRTDSFPHR